VLRDYCVFNPFGALGDSYPIDFRLIPRTFMSADGACSRLGQVPVAIMTPLIIQTSFTERPPSFPAAFAILEPIAENPAENPNGITLTIRVHAPGFDVAPLVVELQADMQRASDWCSFVVAPKSAGRHAINLHTVVNDRKIGEVNVPIEVKQFWLLGRFGLSDSHMRALKLAGIGVTALGTITAILKALGAW
jgi:hypothetical protein